MSEKKSQKSFEMAYQRLEEILNLMNQSSSTLEESLNLYVEADDLMRACSDKLTAAEQKIEHLIKNRTDKFSNADSQSETKPFKKITTL